jgi:hypothetical protein
MFGSVILDVAIGLIFVYLLLSIICSAAKELLESYLKKRSKELENGIKLLLNDDKKTGLAKQVFEHPLICSLSKWGALPSYISARNFALALTNIVHPKQVVGSAARPLTLRQSIGKIVDNEKVKQALLALADAAGDDLNKFREQIEEWFNSTMDRVSGWYKRWSQVVIFCLGVLVTVGMNADTIAIVTTLSQDQHTRQRLVDAAAAAKQPQEASNVDLEAMQTKMREVGALGLPIGWDSMDPRTVPKCDSKAWANWASKVIGWLLTILAISLGAPFWFDILNKFMMARSAKKPSEKSKKTVN